jgi:hypothetical protein
VSVWAPFELVARANKPPSVSEHMSRSISCICDTQCCPPIHTRTHDSEHVLQFRWPPVMHRRTDTPILASPHLHAASTQLSLRDLGHTPRLLQVVLAHRLTHIRRQRTRWKMARSVGIHRKVAMVIARARIGACFLSTNLQTQDDTSKVAPETSAVDCRC